MQPTHCIPSHRIALARLLVIPVEHERDCYHERNRVYQQL